MRVATGVARLVIAAFAVVAVVFDVDYVRGFSTFSTENYFSYFTFQSNLLNILVLAVSGTLALLRRRAGPVFESVRAVVLCYVLVSGIVFGLIVSQAGSHSYRIEVPWTSASLHFVLPVILLVDWVLGVNRVRLRWRIVPLALAFPVVWGVFTLIRGSIVRWYPYFFLDPQQISGPAEFVLYTGIALALFAGITAGLVLISRRLPAWGSWWVRSGRRPRRARASRARPR